MLGAPLPSVRRVICFKNIVLQNYLKHLTNRSEGNKIIVVLYRRCYMLWLQEGGVFVVLCMPCNLVLCLQER